MLSCRHTTTKGQYMRYEDEDDAGICGSCGERIEDCEELQSRE